jgi:hypothetical protein
MEWVLFPAVRVAELAPERPPARLAELVGAVRTGERDARFPRLGQFVRLQQRDDDDGAPEDEGVEVGAEIATPRTGHGAVEPCPGRTSRPQGPVSPGPPVWRFAGDERRMFSAESNLPS